MVTQIGCAGNRRSHTRVHYPSVKGINWDIGAISNNEYYGARIIDVLKAAGFTE